MTFGPPVPAKTLEKTNVHFFTSTSASALRWTPSPRSNPADEAESLASGMHCCQWVGRALASRPSVRPTSAYKRDTVRKS